MLIGVRRISSILMTAVRVNAVPAVVIPLLCLLLVLSYFYSQPVQAFWEQVGHLKEEGGIVASFLAGGLFGGVAPFLFSLLLGRVPKGKGFGLCLFLTLFMAWRGMEVNLLYQILAQWWGDTQSVDVVVKKVLFDQFVWSVTWSGPTTAVLFLWRDHGFSWKSVKSSMGVKGFLKERLLPVYLATWMTWLPTMPLVFSLPLAVQFPIFCLILCFFVLLITALDDEKGVSINDQELSV